MSMPYGSGMTIGGWISIIMGLVILAIMVFGFFQGMKLLNSIRMEVAELRREVDEIREGVEEVRKKLEEV